MQKIGPLIVETLEDGFAFCREKNQPVTVLCKGSIYKLFPSGRAELKQAKKEGN